MKTLMRMFVLVAFLASAAGRMLAQSSTQGGIGGTVEDATGAVIANVTVTIHNDATNAEFLVKTDTSGNFIDPLLEPGVYTVSIAANGFEAYRAKSVTVQVGQITNLLPHLTTGSSSTVVEVTSSAPVLNFEAPDFASNLNTRALENIPVNNLRWSSLALTTPGVVSDSSGFGLVSVRGISTILNNVLIDGADDNQAYYSEERGRTREAYSTPPEAIQEFQVNTGVYQAQYGRAAGGVINSVTKSGGNSIHGQAYFSDRESAWGAFNPYTTNTVGTQNASGGYTFTTSPYKPEDSRKIWGFTAGGALIKDKLFWQYTYDQHHRLFPGTAKANNPGSFFTQPDAATIAGANTVTPPGTSNIYTCNLATGYLAQTSGTTTTAPALDTYACTLAAREGLSSYAAGATAYGNGLGLLLTDLGSVPRTGDQVVNMPKLDYQLNSKNHVSLLYNRLRWDSPGGVQTQATNTYAVDTFGTDFVKLDYGVAKLTSLLSSNISNELLYQYGRELNDEGQQPYSAFTKQYLVGTGGNVPEVALATSTGFYLGSPYYSYRKALPDERKWQIGDTLYLSKGNHSFKFGLDSVHNHDLINNTYESNGYITYSYIGNFLADLASEGKSTDTCNSAASPAGTSSTSGVGNYPCYSTFVQGFGPPVFQVATFDYGLFAQDTWKVSPRLTLELGVRYDNEILPGTSANANLTSAATLGTFSFVPYAALTNAPNDKNNIGPRVGFAYDIAGDGKTVVRGGFGMYYGRLTNGNLLNVLLNTGSPNGQFTASLKGSTFCNAVAGTTAGAGVVPCATGIAPGTQAPVFPNVIAGGTPPKPSSYYLAPNLQNPLVQQFDLIVQRQVGKGTVASVSYLGALGKELTNFIDTNLSSASLTNTTITINNNGGKGPLPNGATYVVPQYTAYTNTNYSTITELASNINSSYNAIAVEVQNRSLKSLQFDVNYVWSHALDYNQQAGTTTSTNNQYDPNGGQTADYGNSQFNVPDRVAGYVLYNLPNASHGGFLKYLANDWAVDTAFQAQSGLPYSAGLSGYASAGALNSSWNGAGGTSWIPVIGRNTYKYPRDIVQDVRLQKQISFTERYKGEARLDLYNVYNHQNVTGVNNTAYALTSSGNTATATFNSGQGGTSVFGAANNSNSQGFLYTPREIQISFKFLF
jgi:hypothetical protein